MEIQNGWLTGVLRVVSPNRDARPADAAIDLLVIHGISLPPGEFGGPHIEALFTNTLNPAAHPYFAKACAAPVSAHVLIRRGGELIQFVPFHQRAWHAGASCFENRARCNDFSIGVEMEGADDLPYEDAQYRALAEVARALMRRYPGITPERIVGHSDIAPERKTDPGPHFDWPRLRALIAS
ncbi:MAG: 1,6-anhydro-N-acetylmuramyl-L-alanine amidase AmpD [Gammaproteobacteria bacterium]